jgi:hypothetical protein
MIRLQQGSSATLPQSPTRFSPSDWHAMGNPMIIQMKTKRRWILSILETVGDGTDSRVMARATVRQTTGRTMVAGQKGFAMRLKTATRQVSDASR